MAGNSPNLLLTNTIKNLTSKTIPNNLTSKSIPKSLKSKSTPKKRKSNSVLKNLKLQIHSQRSQIHIHSAKSQIHIRSAKSHQIQISSQQFQSNPNRLPTISINSKMKLQKMSPNKFSDKWNPKQFPATMRWNAVP